MGSLTGAASTNCFCQVTRASHIVWQGILDDLGYCGCRHSACRRQRDETLGKANSAQRARPTLRQDVLVGFSHTSFA